MNYLVEHCYAVELTDEQRTMLAPQMMREVLRQPIDEDDLLARLESKVRSFQAETLIVHTGFVFAAFPDAFVRVLRRLRTTFPSLKFGIEGGVSSERIAALDALVDKSVEVADMVELLFGR